MVAIVIIQSVVLLALSVFVAGLLRSHAEILRALHDLGVSPGEDGVFVNRSNRSPVQLRPGIGANPRSGTDLAGVPGAQSTLAVGVPSSEGLTGDPAHDLTGVTPDGRSVAVGVLGTGRRTLIAFLTTGCTTCGEFWRAFKEPGGIRLPPEVDRLVVVTHGSERESPAALAALAPPPSSTLTVLMTEDAWQDYNVPVTPYFVLASGSDDVVIGEGAAKGWPQLLGLLERAVADAGLAGVPSAASSAASQLDRSSIDLRDPDGPRGERADAALARAGIRPGDPSLEGGAAGPGISGG